MEENFAYDKTNEEDYYVKDTEEDLEFIMQSWHEVIVPHVQSCNPVLNMMDLSSVVSCNKWIKFIKNNFK